jgi:hypothetical protein
VRAREYVGGCCVTVNNRQPLCVAWTADWTALTSAAGGRDGTFKVGSASGPLTPEARLGVDLSFAAISLVLSTRHSPVGRLHTLHYRSRRESNLWSMHSEERDSSARLDRFTRIHLRCYLSLGSIPSALSPTQATFLASNWVSEVNISAIRMHGGTIGRHVEVATQINPTTRPTFFSRVSISSSTRKEPSARHPTLLIG